MISGPSYYSFGSEKPTDLIVLCHGYGSSGHDLITIAKYLEEAFERPYFIAPNAPEKYEFVGASWPEEYQWFSLKDRSMETIYEMAGIAEAELSDFIDAKLAEFGLTNKDLVLGGFSQGCMISLYTALRRKDGGCRAVLAISGTLPITEDLERHIASKPQICFVHGDQDEIVSISLGKLAYNYVLNHGIKAEFNKVEGLEHYIDYRAIEVMKRFLKSLPAK